MSKYCDNCCKQVQTDLISKNETFDVFDETISLKSSVLVCKECGEELFDEELDNTTLVDFLTNIAENVICCFLRKLKR